MKYDIKIWTPFKLMLISWLLVYLIFITADTTTGFIFKVFIGLLLITHVKRSFSEVYEKYVTMGAFVTMQTTWFIGVLWMPEKFWYINFVLYFLILLGIEAKVKQIKNINKGLSPDLRENSTL